MLKERIKQIKSECERTRANFRIRERLVDMLWKCEPGEVDPIRRAIRVAEAL